MIGRRRRPDGLRRRNPALVGAALLVLVLLGLDYGLGMFTDTIEVVDHTSRRIDGARLDACGLTRPLKRGLLERHRWYATPQRLCPGPTTVRLTLRDGTVDSCTGFAVGPGHDWRVVVTDSGCGGFQAVALPLL